MTQYSQHELDIKIHAFMAKKMKEFPELDDERYYIDRAEPIEKRDGLNRRQLFSGLRLNTQY